MSKRTPARAGLVLGLLCGVLSFLAAVAGATDFYVAPNGSPSGNGSINNPWDLATALKQPAAVHAGDTIWLRGGTYDKPPYKSQLKGTAADPIIVRQYTGERARIDGNYNGDETTLTIVGQYTWFWGFEVFNSDPTRWTNDGNDPPRRGPGVQLSGDGTRMINMIVHDTSQGVLTGEDATDARIYGNLFYYNGYDSPDRGHGHGIYAQNHSSTPKPIYDNILFRQFGWGIHAYGEGGHLDNLDFQGNISFNNGQLSGSFHTNILLGGLQLAHSPKLISNYTYNTDHENNNNLGYSAGSTGAKVQNNYFASDTALGVVNGTGMTINDNVFAGKTSGFSHTIFPDNTYYDSTLPTGVLVFIRPNAYEAKRAHIVVYNWDHDNTVDVDISGILSDGDGYEVRNAADFFGAPVLQGTYSGGSLTLPMTGLSVATPVGVPAPAATGPEFNVFVLLPASPGGSPTPTPTRTPTNPGPTATKTPTSITPASTPTHTLTAAPPTATRTPTRTPTGAPPTPTRTPTPGGPTINTIGPSSGPAAGGTVVTIHGNALHDGGTLSFGMYVVPYTHVSNHVLKAVAPPRPAGGLYDIRWNGATRAQRRLARRLQRRAPDQPVPRRYRDDLPRERDGRLRRRLVLSGGFRDPRADGSPDPQGAARAQLPAARGHGHRVRGRRCGRLRGSVDRGSLRERHYIGLRNQPSALLSRRARLSPPDGGVPAPRGARRQLHAAGVHARLQRRDVSWPLGRLGRAARRRGHQRGVRSQQVLPRCPRQAQADGHFPGQDVPAALGA